MLVLPIVTIPIAMTSDADIINVYRYCARSKMKHHASSLNSRANLFQWTPVTLYKP
jgi:trehalose-6-phosphate synthase